LIYNVQPINLIPDFIPVIGFADNAVVLLWALHGTVRAVGFKALKDHLDRHVARSEHRVSRRGHRASTQ
jgi:uncharacterized membrane protein YkvA (DUF1232 family)